MYYSREIVRSVLLDFLLICQAQDGFVVRDEQILAGLELTYSGQSGREVWCTEESTVAGGVRPPEKTILGTRKERRRSVVGEFVEPGILVL